MLSTVWGVRERGTGNGEQKNPLVTGVNPEPPLKRGAGGILPYRVCKASLVMLSAVRM